MMTPGKRLRSRRGGGRLVCVRRPRPAVHTFPSCQGDASVPTPLHTTPAPTDVTIGPQKTSPCKTTLAPTN
jgi:hypothetical protein